MIKKAIIFFLIFVLTIVFLIRFELYSPISLSAEEQLFKIKPGQGLQEIASNLKKQGFVRSDIFFSIYVYLQGNESKIKAGDYSISKSMSAKEIIDKLIRGKTIGFKITIIEGWDIKDIAQYLSDLKICDKEEFLEIAKDYEGYLFPDTYQMTSAMSALDIVEMMRANFDKKISEDLRVEIEEQKKRLSDIIIMASIIEKEVQTFEDKKLVSNVLWKRIGANMPLQSCATIAYITGKHTVKISVEETQIDSPYNTYKYIGLPIGPICNPSLDSIKASIFPKENPYWYYLSTPEGETIFSKTFKEHNIAKAKYLK
jgi:UPF0755 protein